MADIQQAVCLTKQLYDMRDAAKTILGARFAGHIAQYQAGIRKLCQAVGCSELDAAIEMSKTGPDDYFTLFTMAAFVEMVEPTETRTADEQEVPGHG